MFLCVRESKQADKLEPFFVWLNITNIVYVGISFYFIWKEKKLKLYIIDLSQLDMHMMLADEPVSILTMSHFILNMLASY